VYKTNVYVNGCQINSFCLRVVIFLHKQREYHAPFQACILYSEKVILFYRLVMFICVYGKNIPPCSDEINLQKITFFCGRAFTQLNLDEKAVANVNEKIKFKLFC
jgi:hypothetical protein